MTSAPESSTAPDPVIPEQQSSTPAPIVARAASYYRMTRYIMAALLFAWGMWSIYDGFKKYPADNEKFINDPVNKYKLGDKLPHSEMDININKGMAILFPPLSIVLLAISLRSSRGEIRLDGDVISAPGHPQIPLSAIRELNARLWDKKGIAYVSYSTGQHSGVLRLDDFIYERTPIDQIYDRIVAYLSPPAAETPPASESQA